MEKMEMEKSKVVFKRFSRASVDVRYEGKLVMHFYPGIEVVKLFITDASKRYYAICVKPKGAEIFSSPIWIN